MRIKDLENEELRHVLAHLHCALDALVEAIKSSDDPCYTIAKRHLIDIEAQIFDEEECDDGPHTLPQETQAEEPEEAEAQAEEAEEVARPGRIGWR